MISWLISFLSPVGGIILSALISGAVNLTVVEKAQSIRSNRKKKKAFETAIAHAHKDFKRQHSELTASFFDEDFIRNHGIQELEFLLAPMGEPNAERLARAFAQQYGRPVAGIREPAAAFIRLVEKRLSEESELVGLISFRHQELTYHAIKRIEDLLRSRRPVKVASDIQLNNSEISTAFGRASKALLDWPQLSAGHWIERPELEKLRDAVSSQESHITILVGRPGGGKSALLARLGNELAAGGWALLAIKADQLPAEIDAFDGLDRYFADLGAPASVVDCLQALAIQQPVILLIDQLDALSELMDRKTGRLSALLALVHSAQAIERLRIVLSSREVEYRHDARFTSLGAEAVILGNPTWEDINHCLRSVGVDASRWPSESREALRNVEHLSVFLRHFAQEPTAPVFDTYLSMLETLFQQRIDASGRRTAELAYEIAAEMAESEELWIARARFEDSGDALQRLLAADVLRTTPDGKRVGFWHQTVFEFVRARDFARGQTGLADWVLSHQDSVHVVRPVLWKALPYLRDADPGNYARETGRLWNHDALRPHLRWILISFLGGLQNPRDEEAHWLLSVFDSQSRANLRRKVLMAMTGSAGWFERLRPRLPVLMSGPLPISRQTSVLLARALSFDPNTSFALVSKYWAGQPDRRTELDNVFWHVQAWDDHWSGLALELLAAPDTPMHDAQMLVNRVAKVDPARTAQFLAAKVRAELERLRDNPPDPLQLPSDAPEDEQFVTRWKREEAARKPYRRLLTEDEWYSVPEAARQAPEVFLNELWPILTEASEALAPPQQVVGYRDPQGLFYDFEDVQDRRRGSLLAILLSAVEAYAESDYEGFSSFVEANENSDLGLVHRFLARGLATIAQRAPGVGLSYLLATPERMAVGNINDVHGESRRLISAISESFGDKEIETLERAIIAYRYHSSDHEDDAPKEKRDLIRWNRAHRLRLLRAIPDRRRSTGTRRLLLEEERALPALPDWDIGPVEVSWRGSPMTADQMARASDEQIFAFLQKVGDTAEASLAFSHFAKLQPDRAIKLFGQFHSEEHDLTVAHALRELATAEGVEPDGLIDLIHGFVDRGFGSCEFRGQAAWALQSLAQRRKGLGPKTCAMLEGWITDWTGELDATQVQQEERPSSSVLWEKSGRSLPDGNFPVLLAIALGHLCRDPMDADGWLDSLERHLERRENPIVWGALARPLRYLVNANRDRAVAVMERILTGYPELLASEYGAELIAYTHSWLPSSLLISAFGAWDSSSWAWGPQVAGEVITLRHAQMPEDEWTNERLATLREGSDIQGMLVGMAYSAAHLWGDVHYRDTVTSLMIELIEDASTPVAQALFEIFRVNEPLPVDDATRHLLETIASNPHVLEARSPFLVKRLKGLLFDVAFVDVTARILRTLVDRQAGQIADVSTGWAADADDLMQCALTLQRFPPTREDGVAIFERLIELDAYGVDNVLRDIDRRIH